MLRELQARREPVSLLLPESADIRLEPTPHGAWLYLSTDGMARVVHFREAANGYLWNGQIWFEGAVTADDLYTNPAVRAAMADWNEPRRPPKAKSTSSGLRRQAVNSVRSVSITLSNASALRPLQINLQK